VGQESIFNLLLGLNFTRREHAIDQQNITDMKIHAVSNHGINYTLEYLLFKSTLDYNDVDPTPMLICVFFFIHGNHR
jgi:hypothetical protein